MTNTDWHDLPAGRELDRLVAERLGFRSKELKRGDHEFIADADDEGWYVLAADGTPVNLSAQASAVDAWDDAMWHNPECGGYFHWEFRPWSTSVDAALTLPINNDVAFRVTVLADGSAMAYLEQNKSGFLDYDWNEPVFEADNPALAIVRAWLSWREASDD